MTIKSQQTARRNADRSSAKWSWLILIFFNLIPAAPVFYAPARAQEIPEYRVKAAFLFNFGKFVEWPTNVFTETNAPVVIGIFGKNPFHDEFKTIVEDKTVNGHPLIVRKIKRLSDLKECRIVFISASEAGHLTAIFRETSGAPILTVGDMDGFITAGGMIELVTEKNKIRFEINDAAARRSGLKISSRLLVLAKRPETK